MPDLTQERGTAQRGITKPNATSRATDGGSRGIDSNRGEVPSQAVLSPSLSATAASAETTSLPAPGWPFRVPVSRKIMADYIDNRTAQLAVNAVIGTVSLRLDRGLIIHFPLKEFRSEFYNLVPILPVAESKAIALARAERIAPAADLARLGLTPCAFYRHDSGAILPSILNLQTLPNVWSTFREALNIEGQRALGWARAFEKLLQWYTVARFPIPALRTSTGAVAVAASEFSAVGVANELYSTTAGVANAGTRMLRAAKLLSDMRGLTAAQKTLVILEFFKRIGFVIQGAVVDEGPHFMMIANDGRFAFKIVKSTGEILYGRFNMQSLEYVFEALR